MRKAIFLIIACLAGIALLYGQSDLDGKEGNNNKRTNIASIESLFEERPIEDNPRDKSSKLEPNAVLPAAGESISSSWTNLISGGSLSSSQDCKAHSPETVDSSTPQQLRLEAENRLSQTSGEQGYFRIGEFETAPIFSKNKD